MKNRKLVATASLTVGLILPTILNAQQVIMSGGGNASGSSGSVSYTVGQVAYVNIEGINGSVVQGIQQPQISVALEIDYGAENDLSVSVFPNPTSGLIQMTVKNREGGKLVYLLYDLNGRLLRNAKVNSMNTFISMESFSGGSYLLKVISDKAASKIFTIIKK